MIKSSRLKKVMLFGLSICFGILMGKTVKALHSKSLPTEESNVEKAAESAPLENTLLWKIEGEGLEEASYLFGTIHVFPESKYFLSEVVSNAMASTQRVTFELDFSNPNMGLEMMQHMQMKDGQTIDQLIDEKEYANLNELITSAAGSGLENFKAWQPMMLSGLLLNDLIAEPIVQYEMKLMQVAMSNKQEISGLETVGEQLAAVAAISTDEQVEILLEMIHETDKMKKIYADMVHHYEAQDVSGLHQLIVESSGGDAFAKNLIEARNKKWIERIRAQSVEKSTFFAVGSGHLAGSGGLIPLLRNAGFTVTPVLQ